MINSKSPLITAVVYIMLFTSKCITANGSEAEKYFPDWWANTIGINDIVLPGFTPVSVEGMDVVLGGGRVYSWSKSFFPAQITAAQEKLTNRLDLVITRGAQELAVKAQNVSIIKETPAYVLIEAVGQFAGSLNIRTITRVEYDGLAKVSIYLEPETELDIDGLDFRANIENSDSIRMLAFDIDSIRNTRKKIVFSPQYKGRFLNVLGFADGDKSFWWFSDDAKGWIWNGNTVTEVSKKAAAIEFRQRLIGSSWIVDKPMEFHFNFMATPVKDLSGFWRNERIAANPTEEEARLASFHLWWTNVFAHEALPYTDYPEGTRDLLPTNDIKVYKGAIENRRRIRLYRSWGLERLPYFSAHVLNVLDPALSRFRKQWEVQPPFIIPPGSDAPFTAKLERPWLSQRAKGYKDYLIYRFNELIDDLDLHGIYFDQASIIQTQNLAQGAWTDSNGIVRAATDILATRDFYKRLASLFYIKGRPGYIFAHVSGTPIIPAYTFTTGIVQGEEYTHKLNKLDYIDSVTINIARTQFTTSQYGIRNIWLSQLWSRRHRPNGLSKSEWLRSDKFRKKFRNFMTLALLHDISVWSLAPVSLRSEIYDFMDEFEVNKSNFVGYWNNKFSVTEKNIIVSAYLNNNQNKALLVVGNLSDRKKLATIYGLSQVVSYKSNELKYRFNSDEKFKTISGGNLQVDVGPKDFTLVEIRGS